MRLGVIGAGQIGLAVARHAVVAGHDVVLSNRRGVDSLRDAVAQLGPRAHAGSVVDAADADLVLLATRWVDAPQALAMVDSWEGRVLIDATNHYIGTPPDLALDDLGGRTSAEIIASLAPGARLVKAFNTMRTSVLAPNPRHAAGRRVVFYAGDDAEAKGRFDGFVDDLGFAPVDVGDLRTGGRLLQIGGGGPLAGLYLLRTGS